MMLAEALQKRSPLLAALTHDLLAQLVWQLYRELDGAPDFPVIRIRWAFLRFTLTKEQCEPALRWLLTRLVGPEPVAGGMPA